MISISKHVNSVKIFTNYEGQKQPKLYIVLFILNFINL